MSRRSNCWRPASLAQHFDAPDGFAGEFGWVCGYSADAAFMNDATERFTRLTDGQRSQQGQIALALFVDPGNPQISLTDAPGVAHLPLRDISDKPFRLLHAKVALLGFRHRDERERWLLRLIVSTGNWTRQTLEESLDVAWRVDIASDALKGAQDIGQVCADVHAARDLLQWIESRFDTRLLSAGGRTATAASRERTATWIRACSRKRSGSARIFDNRTAPVIDHVRRLVGSADTTVARNYLAMGFGFYEAAGTRGSASLPTKLVNCLVENNLLKKSCKVDLFVNPKACQGIASSFDSLRTASPSITVRPAGQPAAVFNVSQPRSLHAKFLFSANFRNGSNSCSSAWIYLGSGNLTSAGFMQVAGKDKGNLEAGVVLFPSELRREASRTTLEHQVVGNVLPIQWDDKISDLHELSPGEDWTPPDAVFLASPVAYVEWHALEDGGELRLPAPSKVEVEFIAPSGDACISIATGFLWPAEQPRLIRIRWTDAGAWHTAEVPVVDQYGRLAAVALPAVDLDEAWWQLADFPQPFELPDEETVLGEDFGHAANLRAAKPAHAISSPIRQMMQLLENIASRQTEIATADWTLWCIRLEQTLRQAKDSTGVQSFLELGLNPLAPLRLEPFRPKFAEDDSLDAGRLYEGALTRIERAWRVNGLPSLGDA